MTIIKFVLVLSLIVLLVSPSSAMSRVDTGDFLDGNLSVRDLDGNTFKVKDFSSGRVFTLLFFKYFDLKDRKDYSGQAFKRFVDIYQWYNEHGYEVLAVYCPRGDQGVTKEELEFLSELDKVLRPPFIIGVDRGLKLMNHFGAFTLPATLLTDRRGKIIYTLDSFPNFAEKQTRNEVEKALELKEYQLKRPNRVASKFRKPSGGYRSTATFQTLLRDKMMLAFSGMGVGLSAPTDLAIGNKGLVYVVETKNSRVAVYNSSGAFQFYISKIGIGDKLMLPWSVAVDNNGRVYITDIGLQQVVVFNAQGQFILRFGAKGDANGQFNMPFDIDIDNKGNIFIVDTGNNRIQRINGKFIWTIGGSGSRDGEFRHPTAISADPINKRIYVVDAGNNRIQVFDYDGKFVFKIGRAGADIANFLSPAGVAYSRSGLLFVSDRDNNRVQIFDSQNGEYLGLFGGKGSNEVNFNKPGKIIVDSLNNLYVTDVENNRLQIFTYKFLKAQFYRSKITRKK